MSDIEMGFPMKDIQGGFLCAMKEDSLRICAGDLEGLEAEDVFRHTKSRGMTILEFMAQSSCGINSPDRFRSTPLHVAVEYERKDMVAFLLSKNAEVNARNGAGETPLITACQRRNFEILTMLVEAGADKLLRLHRDVCSRVRLPLRLSCHSQLLGEQRRGCERLLLAAMFGQMNFPASFISVLLKANARVDVCDRKCNTPLHICVGRNGSSFDPSKLAVNVLLLTHCSNINAKNRSGCTPLHQAMECGDMESVLALVSAGCEVNVVNLAGETPMDLALRHGDRFLNKLLLAAGARIPPDLGREDPLLLRCLVDLGGDVPELSAMCRMAFLGHYGVEARNLIGNLHAPDELKKYLAFETLTVRYKC